LLLAAGYLAMTYFVGRAVGRYRLPVEFALYLSACAGLATLPNLLVRRAGKLRGAHSSRVLVSATRRNALS
jgi:hypothetical protein